MNLRELEAKLIIERGAFDTLKERANTRQYSSTFLLTDSNLFELYEERINCLFEREVSERKCLILPAGEGSKTLQWVAKIGECMSASGLDRKSLLVALGGGVVTDVGGLAASLFMRGIDFVNVPTTLVGQIDASLGGKCSVNLPRAKNIMGLFSIPTMVIIDPSFLDTLQPEQMNEGMVELLKIAAVADPELFGEIEATGCELGKLSTEKQTAMIDRAARLKLRVVASDFRESGYRRILNFGHTTGHALEAIGGYGTFNHGPAVAFGILVAAQLSQDICGLNIQAKKRLTDIIRKLIMPGAFSGIDGSCLWSAIQFDKKKDFGEAHFTLLKDIGAPAVQPVSEAQFLNAHEKVSREIR